MKRAHRLLVAAIAITLGAQGSMIYGQTRIAQQPGIPGTPGPTAGQTGSFVPPAMPQPGANPGLPLSREAHVTGNSIIGVQGAIKCIFDVKLSAHVDGILQELMVDEGDPVEAGQNVLVVDERTAMAELAVAEKEAEAAAAQAGQDANLRFSKKVAQVSDAEYNEIKELYDRNSASYQETRRKLLEAEKARLGIEVADVDHSKDKLAAEVAREKVNAAKVNLAMRKVASKYDGVIVERLRSAGEWVKAGEPVFRLVHMKEMKIEANVPVRGMAVSQLQNATIKLRVNINGEEWTHDAKVEYVSSVIEMNTCRIWAKIPNQKVGDAWLLRDGMDAMVDIHFAPQQAVSTR